jgi:hypothetical protein
MNIYKKNVIIFCLSFLFYGLLLGQNTSKNQIIRIIYSDFDSVAILSSNLTKKSIYQEIFNRKEEYLKIRLIDKKGKSYVEHYTSDSILICSGYYKSCSTIYTKESPAVNIDNSKKSKITIQYYCPRRVGIWSYFDKNKKLIQQVKY